MRERTQLLLAYTTRGFLRLALIPALLWIKIARVLNALDEWSDDVIVTHRIISNPATRCKVIPFHRRRHSA